MCVLVVRMSSRGVAKKLSSSWRVTSQVTAKNYLSRSCMCSKSTKNVLPLHGEFPYTAIPLQ